VQLGVNYLFSADLGITHHPVKPVIQGARIRQTAKSHGQRKRGKLSGSAPVVRPLDAKRKNRIPDHEKIVVITPTTLDGVMQLPGAFQ
jgi:hypothetical protein